MENQIKDNVSACQCQIHGILPTMRHQQKLRIQVRRKSSKLTVGKLRKQAGCFRERYPVCECVIEGWSASFPISPRLRSDQR